jgi:hypothetical protein
MTPAQREEASLELAAGAIWREARLDRQSEKLSLAQRRRKLRPGKGAAQVGEGPRRHGHRDAESPGDLTGRQAARAVDRDARTPAARLARNGDVEYDVNSGRGRWAPDPKHAPELSGAGAAEHSTFATGKNRRHPSPRLAQPRVADRENFAMNAVQTTSAQACSAPLSVDPDALELSQRDNPMLPGRDARDRGVRSGAGVSCMHVHA